MDARTAESRRGILNPREGETHFTLARFDPSPDLAGLVERYWTVRWDLRGQAPYAQETLTYPQVNLVFGTHRPGVFGAGTKRFVAMLAGEGWVIGAKFRPGGFRPFWRGPVSELTDRSVTIVEAFGAAGAELDVAVHAAHASPEQCIALIEVFLRARAPVLDPDVALATKVVALAQSDPAIARVTDLAERTGLTVRKLQRLFASHVGVSPRWVLRRFRVHEAAERVVRGEVADWSALACELGYFDQAHFIREFKAQTGRTPGEYAALCAPASSSGDPSIATMLRPPKH